MQFQPENFFFCALEKNILVVVVATSQGSKHLRKKVVSEDIWGFLVLLRFTLFSLMSRVEAAGKWERGGWRYTQGLFR